MEPQTIQNRIYEIRGQKVMIDYDLAELYETETKQLKQAVRRNLDRFPEDFMFQLNREEYNSLRSQFVTLETDPGRGKYSKYLPFAFTEQGVAMLSSILKSKKAIHVNIAIMPDWYLPSKNELNKLYLNRAAIGGFTQDYYWSSSEIEETESWAQSFFTGEAGMQFGYPKNFDDPAVRAVRSF